MIAFDDLRKILLLENVSDSMLGKMVPLLEMRVYSERDIIFQQGDDTDLFYMLKELVSVVVNLKLILFR